jgi:hypothetical protein
LGSVSPSPYKVARHKSPKEPRTAPNGNTHLKHSGIFKAFHGRMETK